MKPYVNNTGTAHLWDLISQVFATKTQLPSTFVGTDGTTAGTSGLVPAPANTDVNKYLKSDGTWAAVGGGSAVVVQNVTAGVSSGTVNGTALYTPYWRILYVSTSGDTSTYKIQYSVDGSTFTDYSTFTTTNTTYSTFTSAANGLVPAASGSGDSAKFLRGDGTWAAISTGADLSFASGTATAGTATLTVTTSASQRTYTDYTVNSGLPSSGTIQLILSVTNDYENYLLLRNNSGADLSVTIGTPTYTGGNLTEVVSTDAGISVTSGKMIEISYLVKGTSLIITSSADLSSAALS